MDLEAYLNGGFQPKRYRPGGIGNWSGHLSFAADLTAAVKPKLFVELGTHYGESYFGFCQAVREHDISCACYAVDTWVGEPQAGFYDESVYNEVNTYNSAHYPDFSYLLRTTFDEATFKFTDESVDILHIDGLHTYQAVAHDLQSWLRKVKPGGIVLMHDVMVRHADFGVWKIWDELASTGKHFIFRHSWGLGVFRKPGDSVPDNGFFTMLFDSAAKTREHARKFYALCATKLEHEYEYSNDRFLPESIIQTYIYPFGNHGYSPENAIKVDVKPGIWEHLSVDILQGTGNGPLRIDPAEQPALIDVSGIVLRRPADGEVLWSAKGEEELAALAVGGSLIRLIDTGQSEFCRFFSYGSDPQLILPILDSRRFDQPLLIELWLRVQTDVASLLPILKQAEEQRPIIQTLQSRIHGYETALQEARSMASLDRETTTTELRNLQNEHKMLAAEHTALLDKLRRVQSDLYVCKTDLKQASSEEAKLRPELALVQQQLAASERLLHEALTSRSWKMTGPVRKLSEIFGAQR